MFPRRFSDPIFNTSIVTIHSAQFQETHGFTTLTRNIIFPQKTKHETFCGAMAVEFDWCELIKLTWKKTEDTFF